MENGIHYPLMGLIIGYACVGLFVATIIAAILDLFNIIRLQADIRKKLQTALVIQVVGIAVGWFSGALKFDPTKVQAQIETKAEKKVNEETVVPLQQKITNLERMKVFIQISDESQRWSAEMLQRTLADSGYSVPSIQVVGKNSPNLPEVRFSNAYPEAQNHATKITEALEAVGQPDARLKELGGAPASTGNFEVWFPVAGGSQRNMFAGKYGLLLETDEKLEWAVENVQTKGKANGFKDVLVFKTREGFKTIVIFDDLATAQMNIEKARTINPTAGEIKNFNVWCSTAKWNDKLNYYDCGT